jgi:hypothetical protein
MSNTIKTASIEAFLLNNYEEQLEVIILHGPRDVINELNLHYNIDAFYVEHKSQIDAIAEKIFYDHYVGEPAVWFANAKIMGFDIVKIDDARRFYTYLAVQAKAYELIKHKY